MHIASTTTISGSRPESKRAPKRCRKLWRCGFALLVLWAVGGCSATRVQDTPTPGNETSPSHTGTQGESATPHDATTSKPDKTTPTLKQSDLQDEGQSEIRDSGGTSGSDYPADKADDSATAGATSKDAPPSSPVQTSTGKQPQEVIISTPVQTASAQPAQPPATISHYTVKGGENLYTIASQPFIYADGMLWPLIYRANRDQIKNPRQIYPGQTLTIPRNISEPDKEQARTKAKESPIFAPE